MLRARRATTYIGLLQMCCTLFTYWPPYNEILVTNSRATKPHVIVTFVKFLFYYVITICLHYYAIYKVRMFSKYMLLPDKISWLNNPHPWLNNPHPWLNNPHPWLNNPHPWLDLNPKINPILKDELRCEVR